MEHRADTSIVRESTSAGAVAEAAQYGPAIDQLLDIVNELSERTLRLAERSRSAYPLAPAPATVA